MDSLSRSSGVEIMKALQAPFFDDEIGYSPIGNGKRAPYVSRQVLQNRLDDVLGVENWEEEYAPTPAGGFICTIRVYFPDGTSRKKEGGGGSEKMQKQSHTEEAAMTNAFKSACRAWGVGRYLKGNGVPKAARHMFRLRDDGGVWAPMEGYPYNERPPEEVEEFSPMEAAAKWLESHLAAFNRGFADACAKRNVVSPADLFTSASLADAILQLASAEGLTTAPESGDNDETRLTKLLAGLEADERRMDDFAASAYQTTAKASFKGAKANQQ